MKQYEAMFLFDPTFGASFEACETEIRRLMERAEAEVIICRKWDERRLAYPIDGRKRGVYVLVYFKAPTEKIVLLERDAKLSENILRLLVLLAEDVDRDAMERAFVRRDDESAKPAGAHGPERPPKSKRVGQDPEERPTPAASKDQGAEPVSVEPVGDQAATVE